MYVVIQHWMVRFLDRGETRQNCWMEPLSLYHRNNLERWGNNLCVQIKIQQHVLDLNVHACACTMYNMYTVDR